MIKIYYLLFVCSSLQKKYFNPCKKESGFFFLFLISFLNLKAQYYNESVEFVKANSVWAFGNRAGLDFNSGTAVPIQTAINVAEGNASVSD